jgi:hypothetical protein
MKVKVVCTVREEAPDGTLIREYVAGVRNLDTDEMERRLRSSARLVFWSYVALAAILASFLVIGVAANFGRL